MKYIIGTIAVALILCTAAFFTLDLWGIENPVTLAQLQKRVENGNNYRDNIDLIAYRHPFLFQKQRERV